MTGFEGIEQIAAISAKLRRNHRDLCWLIAGVIGYAFLAVWIEERRAIGTESSHARCLMKLALSCDDLDLRVAVLEGRVEPRRRAPDEPPRDGAPTS